MMRLLADETTKLLRGCELFDGVDEAGLAEAARLGAARSAARHATLFREGEPADTFMVVVSGRVKLTQVGADGQEVIVRYVGPGEMCAVVAVFPDAAYPATATAVEATRVLAWPRSEVERLLRRQPAVALNALRILSARTRELQERVRELATEKVAQRIARALIRLARQAGRRVEGGVLIDLPLSREDLAKVAGTTLFTVSRTLSAWEADGIVSTGRERVLIRRPHGLVEIAEDLAAGRNER